MLISRVASSDRIIIDEPRSRLKVVTRSQLSDALDKAWDESITELKGNMYMITNRLKQFDMDRADLDDMVEVSCLGKILVAEYAINDLQTPEWLNDTLDRLKTEIAARKRDNLTKALKDAKSRRTALKTAEEKKVDLDATIAELEAKLATK